MNFETWFVSINPEIPLKSALSVLSLADEGATIPFIARYRKEVTGNLDEVAIQTSIDAKERWDEIIKRQTFIVEEIERQEKMTPELKEKILGCFNQDQLEDLYLPYKQKRKTKAVIAKEAGLEPLADWIWKCGHGELTLEAGQTLELFAATFLNEEKKINDAAAALQGAQDIITERLSETAELRDTVRRVSFERGAVTTKKSDKAKPNSKFEKYFETHESVQSLMLPQNSHRYLAMRRGWMEEELTLSMGGAPEDTEFDEILLKTFENEAVTVPDAPGSEILLRAAKFALKAYVVPSIETEVHRSLKEIADDAAIKVFAENVRKLLVAAPFGSKGVLGVDPGIRTGCKLAIVDDSGKFIASNVIHPESENGKVQAKKLLIELLSTGMIRAVAVGNGTAGRETDSFIRETLKEANIDVSVVMVNESGASIYSASETAREEFPDLDLTIRGAISIARRLQDPLAELVKIDPKSIGVGQYQHDVNQSALKKGLDLVVDSCVNSVGVNVNTASSHLLSRVSGIGPALAKKIVEYRGENGLFKSREQLMTIPRFSKKTFEQAAGFLRVPGGDNPLDNTGVHPERYHLLETLASQIGKNVSDLLGSGVDLVKQSQVLRDEIGAFTFDDIVKELEKPGRDPREEFSAFQFRDDIHEVADLHPGMVCPGIVTNVTNFGAFVDIGVHQDGLVHISQLSIKFIKDPRDVVNPGDHVKVRILEVNLEKKQIALTMKPEHEESRPSRTLQVSAPGSNTQGNDNRRRDNNRGGRDNQPRRPEKKAFNNPFADLLKDKK